MSDFNSSLPVRTQNDGDVVSKIGDGTTPSQYLKVEADGSININDNGGSLTVDAVNLDIRDLVFATDKVDVSGSEVSLDAGTLAALESITVQNGAGASAVNIQDGGNSITVDASDLDIRDLVFATDKVDVSGSLVTIQDGGNVITVDATDLDIRNLSHAQDSVKIGDGTDFLAINSDGSINVSITEGAGSELNNYDTSAAVAGGASDNHDYTVPAGPDFLFKRVWASASGKMKIEVQVDTGAGFNTIAVGFNSTANPNIEINFGPVQLVATDVVRVIRTNKDNQAQDVYSTIIGVILA